MSAATDVLYEVVFAPAPFDKEPRRAHYKAWSVDITDFGLTLRSVDGEMIVAVSHGNWISVEKKPC